MKQLITDIWVKVLVVHVALVSMWVGGLNGLALGTAMCVAVAVISWMLGRKSATRSVPEIIKFPNTQKIIFRG
jgi:hypothetical protein